jgi:hypothetical protein
MSAAKTAARPAETETQAGARRRALAAVQEAMDRRDNGGDASAASDEI